MINPRISILLAVHNGERWLDDSITSVLRQFYDNYELIIIPNGCTDRTQEIVDAWCKKHPEKIKCLKFMGEANKSNALNYGLQSLDTSISDFVAIQDADDIWYPNKLKDQVIHCWAYDVIGGMIGYIDQEGWEMPIEYETAYLHEKIVEMAIAGTNPIANCTALIRTTVLQKARGWDATFEGIEDYELWLRLMHFTDTRFTNMNTVLAQHRIHKESHFNSKDQSGKLELLFKKYNIKK